MASKPMGAMTDPAVRIRTRQAYSRAFSDYWALTKPEVNFLIVVTTFAGFYLACGDGREFSLWLSFKTVFGTLLVASGTGTLNQYIERLFDAQMRRTSRRPLAAGRLEPGSVLCFGIVLSMLGSAYLALAVNIISSLLALATLISYLFVYTPLKRRTPLCTLIGAVPGAMPPLIGWAAANGALNLEAWTLYAILFLWQFPHFMAIAWMYREDYARAGYLVLPSDEHARRLWVDLQTVLPLLTLVAVCVVPAFTGHFSRSYCFGSLLLSVGFLYPGAQFVLDKSNSAARRLLGASIVYLFSVFVLMAVLRG